MGNERDDLAADPWIRLQGLADELSAALRVDDVARVIVRASLRTLAVDAAGIWFVDGDVVRMAACEPAGDGGVLPRGGGSPVARVITTGEATWDPGLVIVPIATGGVVHGALELRVDDSRQTAAHDRDLVMFVARQTAIAYERACLYDEASRRQRMAEVTAHRLEKLREAMQALSGARTSTQVAEVTVEAGREAVNAGAATVWLLDADVGLIRAIASSNVTDDYLSMFRVVRPDSQLPVARAIATRTPMWIENEQQFAEQAPLIYPSAQNAGRIAPFVVLPLGTEDRVIGAIAFSFAGVSHQFTDDEREFLLGLAHTCEQALERARLLEVEEAARRAAEAENKRKDEFLAVLGHELRNPLATMTSAMDLIKLRDGALGRELSILDRHMGTLVRMVSDLLDVSRITLGKIQLERTTCDLALAIEHAIETARPQIEARNHTLVIDVEPSLRVHADRERLTQVLGNLLSNAILYTPPGGRIEIRAQEEGDDVIITVRDNGEGMTRDLISTMFDAFVQGPRTLDRRQGGLGIGLTIARQLVEMHGGKIEAASPGKGKGSTLTLRWPKGNGKASTDKIVALTRPTPIRVLVIDHEVEEGLAFARAVEGMGHEVAIVHDMNDALAAGANFAAEIVFLDVRVGGYELITKLRTLPTLRSARFIALGPSTARDEAREADAGIERHVAKPIDLVALTTLFTN